MDFEEKTLTSEYVYNGKVIDVKRDKIRVANGNLSEREIVEHPGGVVILAIKDNNALVVRQYRYPLGATSVEIPAGRLEKGENPDYAAKRELEEETGYVAKDWKYLGYIYTTPGFCNEKLHLYLAQNLKYKKQNPDENEIIECIEFPIKELYKMAENNDIFDSKTLCTLLRARRYLND